MQYILIAFLLLGILFIISKENKTSPLFLFFSIWFLIIIFYLFNFVQFYAVQQTTFAIMLIGFMGFFIGYVLARTAKKESRRQLIDNNAMSAMIIDDGFRYRIIFVLAIICVIMQLTDAIANIRSLMNGVSFNEINIQKIINGEINTGSNIQKSVSVLIVQPFTFALMAFWAVDFFQGKRKWWLTILTLINVALYVLQAGRRFMIAYILVIFYLAMKVTGTKIKIGNKSKIMFIVLIAAAVISFLYLSASRGIENLARSIYVYFCGCIPHLDYRLDIIDQNSSYTYGITTLSGYLTPLFIGLKGIFKIPYPDFWIRATDLMNLQDTVYIGSNVTYNAFVSPFFYFYLDLGIIGVLIGMTVYGIICGITYNKLIKNRNNRNTCYYLMIGLGLLFSMYQLYFVAYPYALSFIYIRLLTKKKTDQTKDNNFLHSKFRRLKM